jgi:hypothetical protein
MVIVALVLFNLFMWERQALSPNMLKQEDSRKWNELLKVVKSSSRILNSPVVAANMVELGLNPIDSGRQLISTPLSLTWIMPL